MINVALFGNPNVGKTTVFNLLTGSNQYVGNWPGVTIEKKEGYLNDNIKIVDLPGIYAMDTFSNEEKVSKSYLENEDVDVIVNVVDASNLDRNLYLTTQLMKYNKPIILLLNMVDLADAKGIKTDYDKLAKELNVTILPIIAKKKSGLENIEKVIENCSKQKVNYSIDFGDETSTYKKLEEIISNCSKAPIESKESISDRIDNIMLNPILAYPLFIGILLLLFKFTFDWVGGPLQEGLTGIIETYVMTPMDGLLANSSEWFRSLIIDGVLGGIAGTLPFFPLIFTLFFGISLFEDSGYMSRAAFLMDKIMSKVGLSGKAFIPMVMGLGCASPAIMATRTLESEKDRKITALISPLMTCGAKLPIYALFVAIFFPKNEALITTSLYLLGIVVAILVALVLNKTVYKTEAEPFVLELPEYKIPTLSALLKNTWNKSKGFLIRVVTVMFAMSVVIWFLSSFNFAGFTENMNESFLAGFGKILTPIFAPLGFKDWRISVALLSGLGAKEIVVNTMIVLFGNLHQVLPTVFTGVTAYSFLIFSALYTPCIASLATMRKEYGNKMMMISLSYQFLLAWVVAFIFNTIANLFLGNSSSIEYIIGGVIVIIAILILFRMFTKKSKGCSSCSSCPSSESCHTKATNE
ncbi:MAG: ferrous iron transport protein B [Clostridiales bacterium]|uniref:ferrous iron transport protein B n=1 Tax=Terrisporobacter sp. TaxID=1965305 RepID=UPI002A3B15B3|nr:ferrous iron transport protein B [Terrisporobacter sp.]MCI6459259.1 ferrous iron transport protein B [Clostridium sp.]MDD5877851.1 ferrous iron transport protein B [Clostridiales bacterium]MCI7208093.1 ferrous iron transport protein B [Clostridium sp.]MDD7754707.1 ferrous iron transport protein B [Clostridiales bacterium]MDY4134904.1 ferrous iron transport protein B [Terrisporobacter sp.]